MPYRDTWLRQSESKTLYKLADEVREAEAMLKQVRESRDRYVRDLLANGRSLREVARRLGISHQAVAKIRRGG